MFISSTVCPTCCQSTARPSVGVNVASLASLCRSSTPMTWTMMTTTLSRLQKRNFPAMTSRTWSPSPSCPRTTPLHQQTPSFYSSTFGSRVASTGRRWRSACRRLCRTHCGTSWPKFTSCRDSWRSQRHLKLRRLNCRRCSATSRPGSFKITTVALSQISQPRFFANSVSIFDASNLS